MRRASDSSSRCGSPVPMLTIVSATPRKSMVSARRSVVSPAMFASISTSTSKRRLVRRSAALAPCRPSKPILCRTIVDTRSAGGRVGGGARRLLLHLALDDLPLHRADHVDEQATDQVIALVLQGPGEQLRPLDLEPVAFQILGPHPGA